MNFIRIKDITACFFLLSIFSCTSYSDSVSATTPEIEVEISGEASKFYYGADLSYVNEIIDCGAVYIDKENNAKNPYQIFKEAGANLVRVRL